MVLLRLHFLFLLCTAYTQALSSEETIIIPPLMIPPVQPTEAATNNYFIRRNVKTILPCFCSGDPVRFSWYRNKRPFEPISTTSIFSSTSGLYYESEPLSIDGVFNGSLVIVGDNVAYTGAYQCFASLLAQPHIRAMSEIAYVHQVYFVPFPGPDLDLKTKSVTKGDYVKLPCPPLDMSPPPHVTWQVADQQMQLIDNRRIVLDDQGTLHILNVSPNGSEFAGQLQCVQTNTRLNAMARGRATTLTLSSSQSARREPKEVYVSSSPVYITVATKQTVDESEYDGALFAVYCIFEGNPLPTVRWTRVDKRELGAGVVADGALLDFRNATSDDSATYQCAVANTAPGSSASATQVRNVTVVVRSAPRALPGVTKAIRVEKTVGETVILNCSAEGEPKPTYSWFFNTVPLESLDAANPVRQQLVSDYRSSQLRLRKADKQIIGVYSCNASSAVGFQFFSFALNIINETRLQATINNKSEANQIELRCTAQVDAYLLPVDLYWKRLPNCFQNANVCANASQDDNDRLKSVPEDGVFVSSIGLETTVTFYLDEMNSTKQRLMWIRSQTYECVVKTRRGNVFRHVYLTYGPEVGEFMTPAYSYINLVMLTACIFGSSVALFMVSTCIGIYIKSRTAGESYLVDERERSHGNDPATELKNEGFSDYTGKSESSLTGL